MRKCHMCDAVLSGSLYTGQAEFWDWFTGYLPETVYFCPRHKNSHERHDLFDVSRCKPVAAGKTPEGK
jgi:hypothetical protein